MIIILQRAIPIVFWAGFTIWFSFKPYFFNTATTENTGEAYDYLGKFILDVMPNLLGFTITAFAVILSMSEDFIKKLIKSSHSIFNIRTLFFFSIWTQATAILIAFTSQYGLLFDDTKYLDFGVGILFSLTSTCFLSIFLIAHKLFLISGSLNS